VNVFKKIVEWSIRLACLIVCICGLTLSGFQMAEVFCRYVLNSSIIFVEELSRVLLIWLGFFGASVAMYDRAHVGIDLIINKLGPKARYVVDTIVLVLIGIYCVLILFGSIKLLPNTMRQNMATLGIPKFWAYLSIPVSMVIFLIQLVYSVLCRLLRIPDERINVRDIFNWKGAKA